MFTCLIIYCFPKFILQEYFEPLVLIIFLSLLDLERNYQKILKKRKNIKYILRILLIILYWKLFLPLLFILKLNYPGIWQWNNEFPFKTLFLKTFN